MITQDKKEYIIAHRSQMTAKELFEITGVSIASIFRIASGKSNKKANPYEMVVNTIREANGTKTLRELAELVDRSTKTVYFICHKFGIPYFTEYTQAPPPTREQVLESHIARHMSRGFTRLQALQIIEEVGEWLMNLKDDTKPIIRPKGNYANPPTGEGLIDKILNS
jgi:hypothetical protein